MLGIFRGYFIIIINQNYICKVYFYQWNIGLKILILNIKRYWQICFQNCFIILHTHQRCVKGPINFSLSPPPSLDMIDFYCSSLLWVKYNICYFTI